MPGCCVRWFFAEMGSLCQRRSAPGAAEDGFRFPVAAPGRSIQWEIHTMGHSLYLLPLLEEIGDPYTIQADNPLGALYAAIQAFFIL